MENKYIPKLGDKFKVYQKWDNSLANYVGIVTEVHSSGSFDLTFKDGRDERGPFYVHEIGEIIRHLTPLEELL